MKGGGTSQWTFTHNPFSGTRADHFEKLMNAKSTDNDLNTIIAAQYDIVLNGYEIGGGSVRNHQADALMKVFEIMGYPTETVEKKLLTHVTCTTKWNTSTRWYRLETSTD